MIKVGPRSSAISLSESHSVGSMPRRFIPVSSWIPKGAFGRASKWRSICSALFSIGVRVKSAIMSVSPDKVVSPADLSDSLGRLGKDQPVTLLYCLADYPAGGALAFLTMKAALESIAPYATAGIGWSSHVPYPACMGVAEKAVTCGATMIEAHLRVRGTTPDNAPDSGDWALWEGQFKELVEVVKDGS